MADSLAGGASWRVRLRAEGSILANAASLAGTMGINSALGFLYWWLAARLFTPAAVGLASAAVSAMMLLAGIGMMGLGTLLIGELPRLRARGGPLIVTCLWATSLASAALGVLCALAAPHLSADLAPLAQGPLSIALFALGIAVYAACQLLDQALIGLLWGGLQFWRNAVFALAKLVALGLVGLCWAGRSGLAIYSTWLLGGLISLAVAASALALRRAWPGAWGPNWRLLRGLGRPALGHHALNLALQAPSLGLPIVVTALLSAAMNAGFYTAWMIASLASVAPTALTTVLYAVGAANRSLLAQKMRLTLPLSLAAGLIASIALVLGAQPVLSRFGASYAAQATWALRLLALAALPMIIKVHYVAVCRIEGRIGWASRAMMAGAILELGLGALGSLLEGLTGLALGWSVAVYIEAGLMARTVLRAARA